MILSHSPYAFLVHVEGVKPDAGRREASEVGIPAPGPAVSVPWATGTSDQGRVVMRGCGTPGGCRGRVHHRVGPEAEDGVVGVRGQQWTVQETGTVSCRRRLRRHRCRCDNSLEFHLVVQFMGYTNVETVRRLRGGLET